MWEKLKNVVMKEPNNQKWIDISNDFEKNAKFPNCFGKDSDSGIYKESSLYKKLKLEKKLDLTDPRPTTNNGDIRVPYVIVADEAFGMSENLMRPHDGKMLYEKKVFNYHLTLARRYVECTF
ncbi:hypothetical protein QTP88_009411 [Uroleucon formosanum]